MFYVTELSTGHIKPLEEADSIVQPEFIPLCLRQPNSHKHHPVAGSYRKVKSIETITQQDVRKYFEDIILPMKGVLEMESLIEEVQEYQQMQTLENLKKYHHNVRDEMAIVLPPGLENVGTICYLNTLLQIFGTNPLIVTCFNQFDLVSYNAADKKKMSTIEVESWEKYKDLFQALSYFIPSLVYNQYEKVPPSALVQALNATELGQQDLNELFTIIMDNLVDTTKFVQGSTRMQELLFGDSTNSLSYGETLKKLISYGTVSGKKCQNCGHGNQTITPSIMILIPIEDVRTAGDSAYIKHDSKRRIHPKSIDLNDAIAHNFPQGYCDEIIEGLHLSWM